MLAPPVDEIWGIDRRNYYTGTVRAYLEAFGAMGHPTALLTPEGLAARLPGARPAAVLDINFSGPSARGLGELGVPYVGIVWDVWIGSVQDPPRFEGYRPTGMDYAFSFEPAQIPAFRAKGVSRAEFLPACCDTGLFRPVAPSPEERLSHGDRVSFYATPMVRDPDFYREQLASIRRTPGPQADLAAGLLERCMRAQEAELFRYRLPALLAGAERASGSWMVSEGPSPAKDLFVNRLSLRVSRLQRVEAARVLAPLGISVWGPEDWKDVLGPGMRYRGHADFQRDLPRIVNASDISLNVPKCHALGAVTPRVFEVLACGGFLLTPRQEALEAFFRDGEDLVTFDSAEDLLAKARHYLDRPEERRRIGRSGAAKVHRAHGFAQRARRIAEVLAADGRLQALPAAGAGR